MEEAVDPIQLTAGWAARRPGVLRSLWTRSGETRFAFAKVPQITALFWITKVVTTAMGESTSDFVVKRFSPPLAVLCTGVLFAAVLLWQLASPRYKAWPYWLCVVMVAVFGTMGADGLHVQLGIPYAITSTFWAIVLGGIFFSWHRTEGTLSIHSIMTQRRELFYWATVLATFALGTALGDLTARTLGIGFLASAVLFGGLMLIPAIGYWKFHLNSVVAFWMAYVLTRPFGASIADWLGTPTTAGGIGFGVGHTAILLSAVIVVLVSYAAITKSDIQDEPPLHGGQGA